jgi:hypothetical protein
MLRRSRSCAAPQVVKNAKQTQARKSKAAGGVGYADDDSKPAEQPKRCGGPCRLLRCISHLQ